MLKSVAGRQVPLTPKQFPIRLSRRIGLRTIGSLGAKKVVVCPSGEQIVNGGFETGDFTGWKATGSAEIVTDGHKGSYFAYMSLSYGSVEQELPTPISYECIETFELFYQNSGCITPTVEVVITYTDDSATTITIVSQHGDWTKLNIKDYLDPEKTVKKIKVSCIVDGYGSVWLDDVSLIGAG